MTQKRSFKEDLLDQVETPENASQKSSARENAGLSIQLKKFRYLDKSTGFFIAYGKCCNDPDIPESIKSKFNKDMVTIRGNSLSLADMNFVGSTIECYGQWTVDPKWGLQYQFDWAREVMPSSIEALVSYLSSGRLKGIGAATAQQIVAKWGIGTLDILNNSPEKLEEIPGLTKKKVEVIKKEWEKKKALYQLTSFFGMHGIGEVWIPKIIESLGEHALEARVRDNPYILTSVDGIAFATADKIGLSLGVSRNSPKRCAALLSHLLLDYTEKQGHTACPVDDWLSEASKQLSLSMQVLQPIAQELLDKGLIILRNLPVSRQALIERQGYALSDDLTTIPCVSLKREYFNERSLAYDIKRIHDFKLNPSPYERMIIAENLSKRISVLDSSQIEGLSGILSSSISILTGGPGTGKTTTLKSVVDIAKEMGWQVILAAPTGRAAKRMSEAIGEEAKTIHRTLAYSPKEGFSHNRNNPLSGKLFIIDEASMLDNSLACAFLKAIPNDAVVCFVGDIDQLPSVGAGSFLKDLIDSNVANTFRLTQVHRQNEGSLIGEAAQKILQGKIPDINGNPNKDDFSWITPPEKLDSSEINDFISNKISSIVDDFIAKGYKKEDIQILSPQRDGLVGVNGLNESLRWKLNQATPPLSKYQRDSNKNSFAVGDRLLVNKNNYDKDIFNGDMGIVQHIDEDEGLITLLMEDNKSVTLEGNEVKSLSFGYAITVHKSQGGEKPVIIMACSPSHTFSMNKNLIYTGITRGKDKVVVVGSLKTLNSALRKEGKMYRLTGLVEEINKLKNKAAPKKQNSPS